MNALLHANLIITDHMHGIKVDLITITLEDGLLLGKYLIGTDLPDHLTAPLAQETSTLGLNTKITALKITAL